MSAFVKLSSNNVVRATFHSPGDPNYDKLTLHFQINEANVFFQQNFPSYNVNYLRNNLKKPKRFWDLFYSKVYGTNGGIINTSEHT